MAEAALAAAAAEWLRQRWLRQRWLRQRRRLVSGGLGLCFCGFLAEAAAAMFLASAAGGDLCSWWPRLVFLRLRQMRRLGFLVALACVSGCGGSGDLSFWPGGLCLCFCQLRRWLVFLVPVLEACFWRPLLVLQQQQSLCVAILLLMSEVIIYFCCR